MFSLAQASRFYSVPFVDYGEHRGRALLVAVGSGIGLATMDACKAFRWLVDADTLQRNASRLGDFLVMAERHVSQIAFAGAFQIALQPHEVRRIALQLSREPIVYWQLGAMGCAREVSTLGDFVSAVQTLEDRHDW